MNKYSHIRVLDIGNRVCVYVTRTKKQTGQFDTVHHAVDVETGEILSCTDFDYVLNPKAPIIVRAMSKAILRDYFEMKSGASDE